MVQTQIQLPEEQYQAIREFAKRREWSLAETFRRGAEMLMQVYPADHPETADDWSPPTSSRELARTRFHRSATRDLATNIAVSEPEDINGD